VIPLRAQDDAAALAARIEAAQTPNRQGLDGLTLPELMRRFHVPGLSIAVIRDFKIESGRPVETTTLFQAASISKPVTAMAAMRLGG
jgi:CubicO group peptidase (beta-lactamase class C family)